MLYVQNKVNCQKGFEATLLDIEFHISEDSLLFKEKVIQLEITIGLYKEKMEIAIKIS